MWETCFGLLAPTLGKGEISGKSLNTLDLCFLTGVVVIIANFLWSQLEIIIAGQHAPSLACIWMLDSSQISKCPVFWSSSDWSFRKKRAQPGPCGRSCSISSPAGEGGWAEARRGQGGSTAKGKVFFCDWEVKITVLGNIIHQRQIWRCQT